MKKKLLLLFFSCLAAILLTSCDEFLSVVTLDENGDKVLNNYVSLFSDKVDDQNASLNSWNDINLLVKDKVINMDKLLFTIENKKENIVVLGDNEAALELAFFDGGYTYTLFASSDKLSKSLESFRF
jgi:hypothetical protein